jgi:hypothetical protein
MEWISVTDRLPKEGEYDWVKIRKGNTEFSYPCKVWESTDGTTSFVNITFSKEQNVTHWRPA